MSLGGTWTSPRLERGSRRAASPLRNGVRANPDAVFGAARVDRPPSAGLQPSEILRRRMRPVPTKTIGALDDPAAAQFSSFAPDGCFPAAVAVRDPLRAANSPMAAQVAARKRRHGLRSAMAAHDAERDISAQELARVRCCSALDFRPATPMSEYTSSRPATSAAVGTFDLGDVLPGGGGGGDDAGVPVSAMYDAAHHEPLVVDRGNSSQMGTEVPVLRVGTPIPRHPLGMSSGSATTTAAAAAAATGLGRGALADGRPTSAATASVNSASRIQSKLASAAALFGKAARPLSAASTSTPVTPQTGPSRPQSAIAAPATAAAVDAQQQQQPPHQVAVGSAVRGMRKTLHWQLRKAAAGVPATSAAHAASEDNALNTETLSLLLRPATPGFATRPTTPAACGGGGGGDATGAKAAAVAINTMLRDRPGTAPQRHATPSRGMGMGIADTDDDERVGSGSDFACRPLRAFAY